ncbi:MAG: hypothetical protein JSS51_12960 [Planctomycetes bacterium]|nr:hypothetical protein [Planctomycetota bacterium]
MSTPPTTSNASSPIRLARPISLADLTEDLLWPRLLRIPAMALRPASITIGFFGMLAAALVGDIARLWRAPSSVSLSTLLSDELERAFSIFSREGMRGLQTADGSAVQNAFSGFFRIPRVLWDQFSWGSLLALISITLILIAGGAVSRIAACEFAHGVRISWVEALGFALRRWSSLLFSFLGPLLAALFIYACVAAAGWVFFSYGWTQIIGAVLFFLAMLASALAVCLIVLTILGAPLLVPAVTCESADAIEAMQRAYAYVPAKPLRYLLYVVLAVIVGGVAVAIGTALCSGITSFSLSAAGAWAKQPPRLFAYPMTPANSPSEWVLRLWMGVPLAIAAAYGFSVVFTGCTVIYLLLRRVVDGQALSDIWVPGVLPGTAMPTDPAAGAAPADASASREAGEDDE